MRRNIVIPVAGIISLAACLPASAAIELCEPLRAFAASVNPGESRVLKFHTIWGGNFKDRDQEAVGAKRCEHSNYPPAVAVCTYLMKYGMIEFAGQNAKAALECLSRPTRFDAAAKLKSISMSVKYGDEERGSLVEIEFHEHAALGGMVLAITASR